MARRVRGQARVTLFAAALAATASFHTAKAADIDVGGQNSSLELSTAVALAQPGDRIRIAQGTYHGEVLINWVGNASRTFTLSGGWNSSFTSQSSDPALTVIDGDGKDPCLKVIYNPIDLTVENLTFQNGLDSSGYNGVGIGAVSQNGEVHLLIRNVIVQGCHAAIRQGAGIGLTSSGYPLTAELSNVIVRGNSTDVNGGGLFVGAISSGGASSYVHARLTNCLLYGNQAKGEGGGVSVAAYNSCRAEVSLVGCTVTGNHADSATSGSIGGGGVSLTQDSKTYSTGILQAYNAILYGNTAPSGGDLCMDLTGVNSKVTVANSDIGDADIVHGVYLPSDNLDADPLFVDASAGDFHLQATSPMIDQGTTVVPDPLFLPVTDLDGVSRSQGSTSDIGAYEYAPAAPQPQPTGLHCFIATAAYGSPMAHDVALLREFRDRHLLTNPAGRVFVDIYYRLSPRIAVRIADSEDLRRLTRWLLAPLVYGVRHPEVVRMLGLFALCSE